MIMARNGSSPSKKQTNDIQTLKAVLLMLAVRRRKSGGRGEKELSWRLAAVDDSTTTELSSSLSSACCLVPRTLSSPLPVKGCMKYITQTMSLANEYGADSGSRTAAGNGESSKKRRRSVTFRDVTVHAHPVILGDNPAVSSGPPVTIDWEAFHSAKAPIDDYEATKPEPREKHQMIVPRALREDWLHDSGYSRREITDASKEVLRGKARRQRSAADGVIRDRLCRLLAFRSPSFTVSQAAGIDAA